MPLTLPAAGDAGLFYAAQTMRQLRQHCVSHRVDPKREDAILLLDALRAADGSTDGGRHTVPTVNRTSFLYAWQTATLGTNGDTAGRDSDLGVLRACQLFAEDYPRFYRQLILDALGRECAEECTSHADDADPREIALRHGEHRGFYALPADPQRLGFLRQWLTQAERDTLSVQDQLVAFLIRSFRVTPGLMWDELAMAALRHSRVWTQARHIVQLAWHLNDRTMSDGQVRDLSELSQRRILSHFAQLWEVEGGELDMAAMDRGIEAAGLAPAGRAFYLLARYNPTAVNLAIGPEDDHLATELGGTVSAPLV